MNNRLMILPSSKHTDTRLVEIPEDMEEHEAFRYVTGLIAKVEEQNSDYNWDDILDELEAHNFQAVDFILGPALD